MLCFVRSASPEHVFRPTLEKCSRFPQTRDVLEIFSRTHVKFVAEEKCSLKKIQKSDFENNFCFSHAGKRENDNVFTTMLWLAILQGSGDAPVKSFKARET